MPEQETIKIRVFPPEAKAKLVTHTKKDLFAGALTGQLAGLIMAIVIMFVFAVFLGHNPLYPVQVIGSIVYGEAALFGTSIPAIVAGLIVHQLGPSLAWGLIFGFLASRLEANTVSNALSLGFAIGIVSMVVDVYILVPWAMKALHGVDIWAREVPLTWDWAAHLIFGLSFSLYPAIRNKVSIR